MQPSKEEVKKRINDSYELPNNVLKALPEPHVSVCIATHQHINFIEACIEGVLMQETSFQWELLIGEDFSKDGTREKVFAYARKYPERIKVITADYNVGMKANKLRVLLAARAKYIAPLDGDDYWTDPQKLQKQVDFMEVNPEYFMCYHSYVVMENNKISNHVLPQNGKDYTADQLIATPPGIAVATKLVRNIYTHPIHDDILDFYNDYDMNAIIGTFGSCKFLPQIKPSIRRIHDGGDHTSRDKKEKLFVGINIKIRMYQYFRSKNDEHRTMIALRALKSQLENKSKQIDAETNIFTFDSARFRIAYKGVKFEFVYAPIINKLRSLFRKLKSNTKYPDKTPNYLWKTS